jgi:hypothetical protein
METKKPEDIDGNYINVEKLEEDSHKVLEFINEELGVREFDNYMVLLDNIEQILKAGAREPEKESQEIEAPDIGDPDYIG